MRTGEVKTILHRGVALAAAAACLFTWTVGSTGAYADPADGSGPAQPRSSGGGFSGGLRGTNGDGAVEKDAQKASDLPAGTCAVSSTDPSGSQSGFTWSTSEPGATSPDKTIWGLSTSFDNSKDRTFADWSFSNSGLLSGVLNTGTVPSMAVGQTLPGDKGPVTAKADEVVDVNRSGRQTNVLLEAELTEAKVKSFAEAGANNPVRYAWQGHYTKDNTNGPKATQGSNASFTALVNPWPSENIECNPITVFWESFDKHVIVEGEETKVGHINIPALQGTGGGTDDSMSRMVVEAYDGNGQFIGTSNTQASGGEQRLRIDANGDIYFTWPKYRGTGLATDKNVSFSVLGLPRTVGQLQAAIDHTYGGNGKAFESSNALTRYNKPNVIDSKTFSLDDTEYHDPKYDKTDATIISGVDSPTGPLATEPQKVTFTQTPDLIKELAKKKDQGGFEAKVTLDEKYVYEGWTVDMDDDYNVTVTAPENPRPGTFARPVITVEYSNGSTDKLELLVVVDPNNTQVTDLVRPGLSKGQLNEDITAQIGLKSIYKGHKAVHPAKYEVDPASVPDGWTVTVDATGKVTAKADDSVAPGTIITPKVKATYPDQTTDEVEVQFQAVAEIKIPYYDTVTGQPNASVSLTPEIPERGLSGNTTDEAPMRYTFEDGTNQTTLTSKDGKTWTVYVDEKTGEITTTIPKGAQEGDILNVPVQAHYSDEAKQKPQTIVGTVVVTKGDIKANYNVQVAAPGQEVKHQVEDAPEGSTFSFGRQNGKPVLTQDVNGWKYTIDPKTGEVSVTPPGDAKPGDKNTVAVTVNAPGGLTTQAPVTTVVKLTNSWEAEPTYPAETVYPGDTATLPVTLDKPDNVNVAPNNPYTLGDVPAGWSVSIDDNGTITATAPADAKPGDKIEIPVTVTYEDGSTDTTTAVVNVVDVPVREVPFDVEYKYDDSIPAGEYRVQTEGKPGEEQQNKDGTWKRTKEPVNEVVLVGIKPAESAKEVTWKVPIPYPTEVRENPDLAPGEIKVVQEGENGEKTFTAKFSAKGDKAEVVEDETTKDPVPRIIEYGPRLGATELVTKVEKPVPFTTEVTADPNLEAGTQIVDQNGELGTDVVTSTQKLVDGKPSGDPTVTTERTKEPTTEKIRVGTKTTGEIVNSVETEIPFDVEIVYDPNLKPGEQKVVQEGVPGTKKVTITQPVENSQANGEATVTEETLKEPTKKIVAVGTKPDEATKKVTWVAEVPYGVETRPNPALKPGEVKVVQNGVPGEKTFTADFSAKGGDATVEVEEKQTKDPVNEIIEYGPTIPDQTLTSTTTREVDFTTEFVFDDSLPAGEQRVDQQGVKGEEEVTATQEIKDGKPVGEPKISIEETKAPTKAIIRVGTQTAGEVTKVLVTEVPFGVRVIYDPTIPAGQSTVDTEGQPGEKEVTITQKVTNSKPDGDATVTEKVTKEPVDQVIRVGTKSAAAKGSVTWSETIPFGTKVRTNPALSPGEVKIVQEGKNGEVKYTATFTGVNGQTSIEESHQRTEPVERIVEVGPQVPPQQWKHKTTARLPFETVVVIDNNLPAGKKVVDQVGVEGEETITITQRVVDGKPVGDAVETREQTKDPVKQIIRVGSKGACDCNPKPTEPSPMPPPSNTPSRTPSPDGPGSPSGPSTPKPSGLPDTGVAGMANSLVTTCLTAIMCLSIVVAAMWRRRSRS